MFRNQSNHRNILYLGISTYKETDENGNTLIRIYFDRIYPTNYFINRFGDYIYLEEDHCIYQSLTKTDIFNEYCRFVIDSVKENILLSQSS